MEGQKGQEENKAVERRDKEKEDGPEMVPAPTGRQGEHCVCQKKTSLN